MSTLIKNNVYWVGKIDWELRHFHGHELSTHHGTSYNSYLIKEEKTVLIDTVWNPFTDEFIQQLSQITDIQKIDAVIVNHAEVDHSGALKDLINLIPNVPIYCTANGVKSLKGHYHQDWNFNPVRTGDRLEIGNGKSLMFFEAPFLHWPDTMFTYLGGDNILFSNDGFGQHLATDKLFADTVDPCILWAEAMKYYANILAPWSQQVEKKVTELLNLKLPIDMILTAHGASWRKDINKIIEAYLSWARAYKENRITIIYDTIWGGTRIMAESIAKGIRQSDPEVTVSVLNVATADKNDVATEVFRSKAIMVGSPAHNKKILTAMAGILEELSGLAFKGKKAAAFGCYGWSGEALKRLDSILEEAGYELVDSVLTNNWEPDETAVEKCIEYGKAFAEKVK